MKKLIILDCSDTTVSIFSIDESMYAEDGDFDIDAALDFIEEKYDVQYRQSEIEWMLSEESLTVTIY